MAHHAGDVACGKHLRVGHGLQGVGYLNETVRIQSEAGFAQPGRAAGARDPDDFVGVHCFAGHRPQARRRYLFDLGVAAQNDTAFGQHPLEGAAHRIIVGRQYDRVAGQQVEAEFLRVAPRCAQLVAQAVLHGQRQFDPAGAGADDRDAPDPGVLAHALEQQLPALVEIVDRFHRHGVLGRAGHIAHLRRGADVDRQGVVGHRRAIAAEHFACVAVQAQRFVAKQTRTGEPRQP